MFEGANIAVFDCEIKNVIDKVKIGWGDHDKMGISVAVVFDYREMRFRVFDDSNASEFIALISKRDYLIGYNTIKFDVPLVNACWNHHIGPDTRQPLHFDMLKEIYNIIGLKKGYTVDEVAQETIGMKKSGNGADAPIWYQNGEIGRVIDYCIQDVNVEKALFEHVASKGYIRRFGNDIPIILPERLQRICRSTKVDTMTISDGISMADGGS